MVSSQRKKVQKKVGAAKAPTAKAQSKPVKKVAVKRSKSVSPTERSIEQAEDRRVLYLVVIFALLCVLFAAMAYWRYPNS